MIFLELQGPIYEGAQNPLARRWAALRRVAQCLCFFPWAFPAVAAGIADLDVLLKTRKSGQFSFVQTSVRGAFDGSPRSSNSKGIVQFVRPLQFRLEYEAPSDTLVLVSDEKVLVYEAPLSIVNIHSLKSMMTDRVRHLLGASGVGDLASTYDLRETSEKGIDWAVLTPRSSENEYLTRISLGFERSELIRIEVRTVARDHLIYQLTWQNETEFDALRFKFSPPAGADVVDHSQERPATSTK